MAFHSPLASSTTTVVQWCRFPPSMSENIYHRPECLPVRIAVVFVLQIIYGASRQRRAGFQPNLHPVPIHLRIKSPYRFCRRIAGDAARHGPACPQRQRTCCRRTCRPFLHMPHPFLCKNLRGAVPPPDPLALLPAAFHASGKFSRKTLFCGKQVRGSAPFGSLRVKPPRF